jgi:hypothetical protein
MGKGFLKAVVGGQRRTGDPLSSDFSATSWRSLPSRVASRRAPKGRQRQGAQGKLAQELRVFLVL